MELEYRYEKIRVIGKGSYGVVHEARSYEDGSRVVIKEIAVPKRGDFNKLMNEVEVLIKCGNGHPNTCRYRDSYISSEGALCIVMEFYAGGDLQAKIRRRRRAFDRRGFFSEDTIMCYTIQLILGLQHIHDRRVIHRDIKSQNVFVSYEADGDGRVREVLKIGDFGISRVMQNTFECAKTRIGTPFYLSPEICQGAEYNHKSDVWSLGCIVYELCSLRHAFDSANLNALVLKILRGKYSPIPRMYSDELRQLVADLLCPDPGLRPSINDLLQRPFVQSHMRRLARTDADVDADVGAAVSDRADSVDGVVSEAGLPARRDKPKPKPKHLKKERARPRSRPSSRNNNAVVSGARARARAVAAGLRDVPQQPAPARAPASRPRRRRIGSRGSKDDPRHEKQAQMHAVDPDREAPSRSNRHRQIDIDALKQGDSGEEHRCNPSGKTPPRLDEPVIVVKDPSNSGSSGDNLSLDKLCIKAGVGDGDYKQVIGVMTRILTVPASEFEREAREFIKQNRAAYPRKKQEVDPVDNAVADHHKFVFNNETLQIAGISIDDPLSLRLEGLRAYLESSLDMPALFGAYRLLKELDESADEHACARQVLKLLGRDRTEYVTLIQQLVVAEEVWMDKQC